MSRDDFPNWTRTQHCAFHWWAWRIRRRIPPTQWGDYCEVRR